MVADWLHRPGSARPSEALLDRKAADFLTLAERLEEPLGDEETRRLRSEAASALAAGRFADADKALAQAELHSIGGSTDLSGLPLARRLLIGENRADRAAVSFLRTAPDAYREAAGRYGEASALIGLAEIDRSRIVALAQATVLIRISEDFGARDGYDAAVTVLRRLLEGLDSLAETVAFAGAQDALATALEGLADIAGEADLRIEALARCRAGLEDLRREEAPLLWHALKVRFGRLAVTLGEAREDDALLEEAVAALATVLAVWDRSRDEARWLEAEHMISRARAALGGRRNDLALLERAFNGFNRVAKAVDRAREPLRWAELQDQMGGVLAAMGERYSEPVVLEEAIAAFAAALEERRRETVPLLWATSSANQALATMRLAERHKDPALTKQALTQIAVAIEAMRSAGFTANAVAFQRRLAAMAALAQAAAQPVRKG
ncbi:hypothetical protein [Bosea sp. (in: a-proteobacteria)]|jgi:tetratricopeptide (TPR) repeat protein|uniref:hypothetical protein n=1 Tax=Bosea sp. (in: a-proteobacteria) TaxID=1871050 RepID=UPI003F70329F